MLKRLPVIVGVARAIRRAALPLDPGVVAVYENPGSERSPQIADAVVLTDVYGPRWLGSPTSRAGRMGDQVDGVLLTNGLSSRGISAIRAGRLFAHIVAPKQITIGRSSRGRRARTAP